MVGVWKETFAENVDSLINNLKIWKANSVEMSVERYLICARFEEHVCALQTLVDANVEQKVTLTDVMATVRELLESVRSSNKSDYSLKITK